MLLALILLTSTAFSEPTSVADDIYAAATATADAAHSVAAAADAASVAVPSTETPPPAAAPVKPATVENADSTATNADTTTAQSDVSPTLRYLLEEFKGAVSTGLPLASDGVKSVCTQIQLLGGGLILFNIALFAFGMLLFNRAKKLWLYGVETNNNKRDYEVNPIPYFGAGIAAIAGAIAIIISLSNFYEPIMMATAPIVWALSHIFGAHI